MPTDNGTVSFDYLGSFWNTTSQPTAHTLSDGISVGTLSRYQTVTIEAVPVVSFLEQDMHKSEFWAGRQQQ